MFANSMQPALTSGCLVFDLDFGRIGIQICYDIEWTILESQSPDIKIRDVLDEFDILTLKEHIERANRVQNEKR